jgi:Icc-related predicted phosphoesterase
MIRIFALSDIHVDFNENELWIDNLSDYDYRQDVLLLAGDICHNMDRLQSTLLKLRNKFNKLFFVPGNHDLWVRGESWTDSIEKFNQLQQFCRDNQMTIHPEKVGEYWIVPLLSWYTQPSEGADTLYFHKPGEDPGNRMWSDNYFVKWPNSSQPFIPSKYFFACNEAHLNDGISSPVISMSHFIPRKEIMFSQYPPVFDPEKIRKFDRNPQFNFSRVAGSELIDSQIRKCGSQLHVYGHQHINRDRVVDGIRYVAHCLGYPAERRRGLLQGIDQGLKLIARVTG